MPRCCKCNKKEYTPYQYETGDPLCESCASNLQPCTYCGKFFEHEHLNGDTCEQCIEERDDW